MEHGAAVAAPADQKVTADPQRSRGGLTTDSATQHSGRCRRALVPHAAAAKGWHPCSVGLPLGSVGFPRAMTLSWWLPPAGPPSPERVGYDFPYSPAAEHGKGGTSKGGGGQPGMAMSALTLLAFLFFLNILQNCLRDSVAMSSTPGGGSGGTVLVVPQVPATALQAVGNRYRRQRGDGDGGDAEGSGDGEGREDVELEADGTSTTDAESPATKATTPGTKVASPGMKATSPGTEAAGPVTEGATRGTEAAAGDGDEAWVRIDAQP